MLELGGWLDEVEGDGTATVVLLRGVLSFVASDDAERLGNRLKVNPSIKTRADADAILAGLRDGTIEAIGKVPPRSTSQVASLSELSVCVKLP